MQFNQGTYSHKWTSSSWWERILVWDIFTTVIIDSMVLVEVLRIILSNDPNWYTKSAKN
jgi:hypothetical protein